MDSNKGLFAVSFSFFVLIFSMMAMIVVFMLESKVKHVEVEYLPMRAEYVSVSSESSAIEVRGPVVIEVEKVSKVVRASNPGVARKRPVESGNVKHADKSVSKKVCIHRNLGQESISSVAVKSDSSRLGGRKVGVRYNFGESTGVEICE